MKRLSEKAFVIILVGLIANVLMSIINLAIARKRELGARLVERIGEERANRLAQALFRMKFVTTAFVIILCLYFIYRLVRNRQEKQGQKYITFLYVVSIISVIISTLSLISGRWLALFEVAISVTLIVGTSLQRGQEVIEYDD